MHVKRKGRRTPERLVLEHDRVRQLVQVPRGGGEVRPEDLAAAANRGLEPLHGAARAQTGRCEIDHLLPALVGAEHLMDAFICQDHDTSLEERHEEKDAGAPDRARESVLCKCRMGAFGHVVLKQGLRQEGTPQGSEAGKAMPKHECSALQAEKVDRRGLRPNRSPGEECKRCERDPKAPAQAGVLVTFPDHTHHELAGGRTLGFHHRRLEA
jgi:hypothetical protein